MTITATPSIQGAFVATPAVAQVARSAATQTLTPANTFVDISFDTQRYASGVGVATLPAINPLTIQNDGIYQVMVHLFPDENNATAGNQFSVNIMRNGAVLLAARVNPMPASQGTPYTCSVAATLTAGDTIGVQARMQTGATSTVAGELIITQLGTTAVFGVAPANSYSLFMDTRAAAFTLNAGDFGKYIRLTAAAAVPTLFSPVAGDVGKQVVFRNAHTAQITALPGPATVSGSLIMAPSESISLIATGVGTWDVTGGV